MKKVLVFGAGLVARPLVRYLLDQPDFEVTVADQEVGKADAMVAAHPRGRTLPLKAGQSEKLDALIGEHDLAISLLPAPLHPIVADLCVRQGKHMVAASYLSPQMKALDAAARKAGVTILNEIGLDPGIDHMSAMRVIDRVKERGGRIESFRSYCGGLPAPQDNDNPFGYKFSWSPRAVCVAGKNPARFLEKGKQVDVPGSELFARVHPLMVEDVGELEAYPNRDSLKYIGLYKLEGIETMLRGTLRYKGWCDTLKCIVDLGLLDETPVTYPPGTTYAQFMERALTALSSGDLRQDLAGQLGLDVASPVLERFEWLGLLGDEAISITGSQASPLDVLCTRMAEAMVYKPGERDMIVLCHHFVARFDPGVRERITTTMIEFGQPDGDSAMARTVGLPAAIAAKLIVTGQVVRPGVHIPVIPDIYNPVLDELAEHGIGFIEKTERITT